VSDDGLFEARVRTVLIDFDLCRVKVEPDAVRGFVNRIFKIPADERERIAKAVLERASPPPPEPPQELPVAWQIELRRLGKMSKLKSHERTGDNEKVKYSRWCYAKSLIRQLQESGMSVAEIGREVKGQEAWGSEALKYNGMVAERDIKRLERLAEVPTKGRAGRLPMNERLTDADVGKLAKTLYTLREKYGWTHELIGSAIGMGDGQVSKIITKGKGGSRSVLDRALHVLRSVQNGDGTGAAGSAIPPTPAPEPPKAPEPPEETAQAPEEPETEVVSASTEVETPVEGPVAVLEEATKKILEAADLLAGMGKRLPGAFGEPWTAKASALIEVAESLT